VYKIGCCGMDSDGSEQGPGTEFIEHGNEKPGAVNGENWSIS
jgi:hypothetical protein